MEGYKDPNEALVAGNTASIKNAIWNAKLYEKGGILKASEVVKDVLSKKVEWGLKLPFETLTAITYGLRMHELWVLGAGTGMGKTEVMKELITWFTEVLGINVGVIFLEETPEHTVRCLLSKHVGRRAQLFL